MNDCLLLLQGMCMNINASALQIWIAVFVQCFHHCHCTVSALAPSEQLTHYDPSRAQQLTIFTSSISTDEDPSSPQDWRNSQGPPSPTSSHSSSVSEPSKPGSISPRGGGTGSRTNSVTESTVQYGRQSSPRGPKEPASPIYVNLPVDYDMEYRARTESHNGEHNQQLRTRKGSGHGPGDLHHARSQVQQVSDARPARRSSGTGVYYLQYILCLNIHIELTYVQTFSTLVIMCIC